MGALLTCHTRVGSSSVAGLDLKKTSKAIAGRYVKGIFTQSGEVGERERQREGRREGGRNVEVSLCLCVCVSLSTSL